MSRPKAANAAATRQRILVAAGAAFAERGRDGASIRGISSAASVSLAMVHHYFGNKDGLYEACIEEMYRELEPLRDELLAALAAGGQDLGMLLETAVRTGFRFARSHQGPSRLLFRQLTVHGELDEHRRETHQRPFLDAAALAIASITRRKPHQLRLPLQSAIVLVARYGISSENELAMFAPDVADPLAVVEDHLVRAVSALLLTPQELPS